MVEEEDGDEYADAYSDPVGAWGSHYIVIADIDLSDAIQWGTENDEAGTCPECSTLGYNYDTIASHNCTKRYLPGQHWFPHLEMVARLFRELLIIVRAHG